MSENDTMKDVRHTAPHGDDIRSVWHRGGERTTESEDSDEETESA